MKYALTNGLGTRFSHDSQNRSTKVEGGTMMLRAKLVFIAAAIALMVPAMALANPGSEKSQGQGQGQGQGQSGPNYETAPPPQAKAYGKYCQGESKKHVRGEKGTAFSRCVTNVAHAANHENQRPGQVCKGKSKKHVKGEKGTEFSRCVTAVAKLRHDERQKEREEKEQP